MSDPQHPSGGTPPPAAPYGAPAAPAPGYTAPGYAPPPRKKSILSRWWFWVVIVIVVLIVANALRAGSDDDSAGGQESATSETEQAADEGTAASDEAAEQEAADAEPALPGIGDTVSVGDLEVTVTSIEAGVGSVGDEYVSEEAQGAFTLLGVRVTNTGQSATTVISSMFTVRDPDDREFEASSTASLYLDDTGFIFEDINPGNTLEGILVFDLPEGTAATTLDVDSAMFGGETVSIALT